MPNFVDDDTALQFPKVDRRSVPPGETADKFIRAADWNEVCQAAYDLRTAVQDLQDSGGGSPTVGTDPFGSGANMATGLINNYDDAQIATKDVIIWKGADNEGTTVTGLKSYDLPVGTIRYILNPSISEQDVGTVTLKHEDSRSLAANRFALPGEVDYQVDIHSVTIAIRGYKGGVVSGEAGDARWVIVGTSKFKKVFTQALHLYPNAQIGTPAAPLSGSLNDYNPTGQTLLGDFSIAGSDLIGKNHTLWRMYVDSAGASLTGIYGSETNNESEDFGRVHVLYNHGPGVLTLAHRSGSSATHNQIWCPNQRDLKIPADGAAWLIKPYYGIPDPGVTVQWRVIGASFSNETFPSVTTEGAITGKQLILTPSETPTALAKFTTVTSNYNPGTNTTLRLTTHAHGSLLDGLIPTGTGDIRLLVNVGTGPLILADEADSASTSGYRFALPGSRPMVVMPRTTAMLRYDATLGSWIVINDPGSVRSSESATLSIATGSLAATSVNNLAPTDTTTGLPGRYAYWWKINGQVGTVITGVDQSPTGAPVYRDGDRILLTNGGSGLVISHANAASDAANRIYCPSGSNVTLAQYGTVELVYHGGASVWMLTMKAS